MDKTGREVFIEIAENTAIMIKDLKKKLKENPNDKALERRIINLEAKLEELNNRLS